MATPGDAPALSRIHAETWEDTYVGQVSDALAHERIAKARARDWAEHGELRTRTGGGVVVLMQDQHVVGFCEFGPTEDADDDPQRVGHIMRLYVHPLHQGLGGGKLLVESACARLAGDGYEEATLWTLDAPSNRARGFYAHLGWTNEGIRNGEQPPDVRYRRGLSSQTSRHQIGQSVPMGSRVVDSEAARDAEGHRTEDEWHYWRGTAELFAHIAAAGLWSVEGNSAGAAKSLIDVEVAGDHELFLSPSAFVDGVTPEALKHFSSITTKVTDGELQAEFKVEWQRPWWKLGWGPDANVTLRVQGKNSAAVESVRQRMCAAIARGKTNTTESTLTRITVGFSAGAAAVATVTLLATLYLLKLDSWTWLAVPVYVVFVFIGILWGSWALPVLEIAPPGQTKLRRLMKSVGPPVIAILLAGVTKLLYG